MSQRQVDILSEKALSHIVEHVILNYVKHTNKAHYSF